ncbi:MAG: aminodeoxychorismate/anthranilate synthase component II [Gammaproteobacteria bacterium]|nr:aminodeoxychorismate/anthranilate synthase component II [Gammaproteobacteria bacterium]MDH3413054.1 aminodeoxychorismate/anthranilate synthase component II [Gammaproteobacteria bacterium]
MLLMIDNYDSFTYNLVQYLGELGADVHVFRNDALDPQDIAAMKPRHIVISPGPCTPNEAGISIEVIKRYGDHTPILGVCLGHQCIGQAYGGEIVHARAIMHGKTSMIRHHSQTIFTGIENPFEATRYHSLVIEPQSLPPCLEVTAWTENISEKEIMAVRHRSFPVAGVQFHPESILTRPGHRLLKNFLKQKSAQNATETRVA